MVDLTRPSQSPNHPQGPRRITFDTNPDDCNLACIICEEHSQYQRQQKKQNQISGESVKPHRMDPELIRKIVRDASITGLREIIPSTMGEPLLYPYFDAIITCCRQYGVFLNLTTNGTFPGRPVNQWGKLILPIASDVKLSWNS